MKKFIPVAIKETIKRIADFLSWTLQYRAFPVVIENRYGIKQLLYPWDTKFMKLIVTAHDYVKEFAAADKLIVPGSTVIDVGANVGVLSAYYSRRTGSSGVVHAFEPVLDTFTMLEENLALNHCKNVHAHHCGMSEKGGTVIMSIFEKKYHTLNTLGNMQIDSTIPKKDETITLATLDEFCAKHDVTTIDFLKVDVEGFEENVFRGASSLLSAKKITYIQFEISLTPLHASGNTVASLFTTLTSYGYNVYRFDETSQKFSGPIHAEDNNFDNYYASHLNLATL